MKYTDFFRVFGVVLFIYILSRIDVSELAAAFREINLAYYLLGLLALIAAFLIRVWKWRIVIESVGANPRLKNLVAISVKGAFWGLLTPGRLGELWKAKYLSESTGLSVGKGFYTAFIDRIVDLLVIVGIGLPGMLYIYWESNWQIPLFIFLFLIVLFYFLIRKKSVFKLLIKLIMPSSLKDKADSFLTDFYQGFQTLNAGLFLKILAMGLLYYLFGVFIHYFIALALGITIPFWYMFLIVAIVWIVWAIPVTVLGLGTKEITFIYFFSLMSIAPHMAVTLSLLILSSNLLIIGLPGAILVLKQK